MNYDRSTILVVEDDTTTRMFLADNFLADGYSVLVADTAADGLRLMARKYPDLAVVDLGLPDADGLELISRVRDADGIGTRINPRLPVLVLSGRTSELDRLRVYERDADDYLSKPFSYPELRARVARLLRWAQNHTREGFMRAGDLEVDPLSREVRLCGRRVELSQKEFAMLRLLVSEPTRVFTKEELMRAIWGFRGRGSSRTLDSHACRLRRKLRSQGHEFVINVWGVGYKLLDGRAVGRLEAVAA